MKSFLLKKLKKIPDKPGVYLLKDSTGRIIYIGKAANIKKRVQSHFITLRQGSAGNFFSSQFANKVVDVDYIKTANENEAFFLEDQLIKKYKPRYNIQWKDDKSYFWVTFSNDEWPRITIVHQNKLKNPPQPSLKGGSQSSPPLKLAPHLIRGEDRGDFFGPFVSGRELRHVLRALRKIIPFRTCKNPYNKPCLQWHLGLCPAHDLGCRSGESPPERHSRAGRNPDSKPGSCVKHGMTIQRYNYLSSLNALAQFLRLYADEPIRIEAYDISNIQGAYATGSMIVFYGNKPSKKDYRRFRIKTVRGANDVAMVKEVIRRRFNHLEWPLPDLILVDGGKAQISAAASEIRKFGYLNISIISLAKRKEEIYTEYSLPAARHGSKILRLAQLPLTLRLAFQAIRNEAHRFAIFYYRYLHGQVVRIPRVRLGRTKNKAH